jgi:hypothetical protein
MIKFLVDTPMTVTDPDGSERSERFSAGETTEAIVVEFNSETKTIEFGDGARATVPFDNITEEPEQ